MYLHKLVETSVLKLPLPGSFYQRLRTIKIDEAEGKGISQGKAETLYCCERLIGKKRV